MSESDGTSSSQDEIAKSFHYLPERQAKVATLLNMMKKSGKEKEKEKETSTDDSEPIYYCICRSTDGTRFMICCDYCEEWYHGDCIGIEKEASKSIKRYACPPCEKNNPEAKTLYKERRDSRDSSKRDKDRSQEEREKEDRDLLRRKKKKKKKKLEEERQKRKEEAKKKKKKSKTSGSSSEQESRKATGAAARHARRCGQCKPCQVQNDCSKCDFCLDMKKYGGQNKLRQKCRLKQCIRLASKVLRKHNSSQSDTSMDTDSDAQSAFSDRYIRQTPPSVDVSLLDHYDYAMRPEMDPASDKDKEKKDKKEPEPKKQTEPKETQKEKEKEKEKEKPRPTKEERKRKRSQQKQIIDEPKFKRVLRSHTAVEEDLPQCYGPGCVNAARPGSKYCGEACGLKLATNRLFEFLPQRIQQWQRSPCIAEENNKKSLEKMRSEMEAVRKKIAELDEKIVKLKNLVERAKKEKVSDDQENTDGEGEEAELSIFCVSCGHPINPVRALRHMSKCYNKYESQTSFGSAFKTRIVGESMFCDFFNQQQNTYCKRLKVLCPEHTKDPKVSADEVCGCPLVADVFQETKGFCHIAKRKCSRHHNWEKLRRAEIDLERVRWWLKLDELLEQERSVRQAMFNRAGVLGLMLHQTLDHSMMMAPGVPPPQQQQQQNA